MLQFKNIVYIIKYANCKEIYIGCIQALNNKASLHKSNITLPENRKLYVSKHLYVCSKKDFVILPTYQKDDYSLLQIKAQLNDSKSFEEDIKFKTGVDNKKLSSNFETICGPIHFKIFTILSFD